MLNVHMNTQTKMTNTQNENANASVIAPKAQDNSQQRESGAKVVKTANKRNSTKHLSIVENQQLVISLPTGETLYVNFSDDSEYGIENSLNVLLASKSDRMGVDDKTDAPTKIDISARHACVSNSTVKVSGFATRRD